jgi:hypothetical protein
MQSDLLDECAKLLGSEAALRREVESLSEQATKEAAAGTALKTEAQVALATLSAKTEEKFKLLSGARGARARAAAAARRRSCVGGCRAPTRAPPRPRPRAAPPPRRHHAGHASTLRDDGGNVGLRRLPHQRLV